MKEHTSRSSGLRRLKFAEIPAIARVTFSPLEAFCWTKSCQADSGRVFGSVWRAALSLSATRFCLASVLIALADGARLTFLGFGFGFAFGFFAFGFLAVFGLAFGLVAVVFVVRFTVVRPVCALGLEAGFAAAVA